MRNSLPVLVSLSLCLAACADIPVIAQARAPAPAAATSGNVAATPAAGNVPAGSPASNVAVVNGTPITQSQFDRTLAIAVAQGGRDSVELRRSIREELITRELLAQEAIRLKLDNDEAARYLLAMNRQTTLVEIMVRDHLTRNPITDGEIQAEYQRQLKGLEERGGTKQYRLRQITVKTEAEALSALGRVRKGESMEAVARQVSIAPSREQGGLLDWLSPLQMQPSIASVIVNLGAGTLAAAPIRTENSWTIIRVEELRPFQPPNEEQVRGQLRNLLIAERRAALIRNLRSSAQIVE